MAKQRSENREVALNMYMDGYTSAEISEILDISNTQLRQWKMLDKWDDRTKDSCNPKEFVLIILNGLRVEHKECCEKAKQICEVLINAGYTEHGADPETLYEWLGDFVTDVSKPEAWQWVKHLWNKGDCKTELYQEGYLTNEIVLPILQSYQTISLLL
jgi:hypothetical protein